MVHVHFSRFWHPDLPIRALCSPLDLSSCVTQPDSTRITYERSTPRYELLIYHTIRLTLNSRYLHPNLERFYVVQKNLGLFSQKKSRPTGPWVPGWRPSGTVFAKDDTPFWHCRALSDAHYAFERARTVSTFCPIPLLRFQTVSVLRLPFPNLETV